MRFSFRFFVPMRLTFMRKTVFLSIQLLTSITFRNDSPIMGLPYNISDLANLTLMVFSFIFPGPPEGLHVPFPPRDSRLLAGLQEVAHDSAGSLFCFNVPALLSIVHVKCHYTYFLICIHNACSNLLNSKAEAEMRILQDPRLWTFVSLRPEISGLHVDRQDTMLRLIPTKFPNLRYLELATELITPVVRIKAMFIFLGINRPK